MKRVLLTAVSTIVLIVVWAGALAVLISNAMPFSAGDDSWLHQSINAAIFISCVFLIAGAIIGYVYTMTKIWK